MGFFRIKLRGREISNDFKRLLARHRAIRSSEIIVFFYILFFLLISMRAHYFITVRIIKLNFGDLEPLDVLHVLTPSTIKLSFFN
jgi:hypothetical protein